MRQENLTEKLMREALGKLDGHLPKPLTLILGGGGAMILAHHFPLSTTDIDAIAKGISFDELDPLVKLVAKELDLAPDWLNPWFSSFSHTLPSDFSDRLIKVFKGRQLEALALGATDLLVMKCFAHRQKDVGHAKALVKAGADIEIVRNHIEKLLDKKIPQADEAIEFLEDILDQL